MADAAGVRTFPCTAAAVEETRRLLRGRGPPVGVFDIDDTLLVGGGDGTKIEPTAALAREIVKRGGAVELVTARPEAARRKTVAQLGAAGLLPLVARLHMPGGRLPNKKKIADWKAAARAAIEARRGRLDVAVGDKLHDIVRVPVGDIGTAAVIRASATGGPVGLLVHYSEEEEEEEEDGNRDRGSPSASKRRRR